MNNKIIAAAVAVLIVIAAVAAVLMTNNDDDRIEKNYEGRLQILGNANNDDYLDNDDVEALKKIISESGTVKQSGLSHIHLILAEPTPSIGFRVPPLFQHAAVSLRFPSEVSWSNIRKPVLIP